MKLKHVIIACITSMILGSAVSQAKSHEDIDQFVKNDTIKINLLKTKDKYKKGKFDFSVEIENLSGKSLVFYYGEMLCHRNGEKGRLDYPFFGAGERSIDLKPGEVKRFNYSCRTARSKQSTETFEFTVGRIFDNPNNDGLTSGKLLSKGLSMKVEYGDE